MKSLKTSYIKNNINTFPDNPSDFEILFRSSYSNLCAYANKFLKDIDASEEIVQELFYNLWSNRESLNITSSVNSYLFRSVRNSCLNMIKHINIREEYKEFNEAEIKGKEVNFEDTLETSELEQKIRRTIDMLPTERRKVFIMSRYDGLKYREIAEKLNISIKTVENQMGKAIKFLREQLSNYLIIAFLVMIEFLIKIFEK